MKLSVVLGCGFLLSCKYGGSDEDPSMGFASEDGIDGPSLIDAAMSGNVDSPASPSTTPPKAGAGSDAGKSPVKGGVDAGKTSGGSQPTNGCEPVKPVATCDPVRNTGCPPLTQCDIETSATTATGRCVFYSAAPGIPCSSSFVNVACDAQNTCVAGECRKMCYCDSDCPPGKTCSDTSGPGPAGAFKLCR